MKKIIGRINPEDKHVTIWGAGFAGLILAYYLKQQGYRLTIYERSDRVGGKISTKKNPFGIVETAANALFLNQDVLELIKEIKLEPLVGTKNLRRLLMFNGKPKKAFQLSILLKVLFNAHRSPPLITDGLTVAEFFRPLLGDENINNFLTPALSGVYATSAESLHFKSLFHLASHKSQFNSYWDFMFMLRSAKKSEPKLDISGSVSFEGGMQELISRLAEILKAEIKLNYKERFRIKGNTILCTDAFNAAELVAEVRPEISTELRRIKYQQLSSVTVIMKREIKSLQRSFGVLIPLKSEFNAIGVLNNKAIFPSNSPNIYSYTLISRKQVTEEETHRDLKLLYSPFVPEDIEYLENIYWEKAIPIYDLQRYLSVKRLHQLTQNEENLVIFGNYVAGISLREMVTAARSFVQDINKGQ
jgi:protoporphyrinogen/coproporphyrinogen III oxidase